MGDTITDLHEIASLRRSLGPENIGLVEAALACGWRATFVNGNTGVAISSPGNIKTFKLSTANTTKGNTDSMMRAIKRYGDPVKVERLDAIYRDKSVSLDEFDNAIHDAAISHVLVEAIDASLELDAAKTHLEDLVEQRDNPKGAFGQPADHPKIEAPKPYIVTERPAMMHLNLSSRGGKSYPSKTSVERRWSDGHVDYRCAVEIPHDNDVSDNKRSFGGKHWARHVKLGEAQPVDVSVSRATAVEDPKYTEPAYEKGPSERVFDKAKLIATILARLDVVKLFQNGTLAETLAAALFSAPESDEPDVKVPLTDAQVLDRIRRLMDNGHYAEQEEKINDLSEKVETMSQKHAQETLAHDEALAIAVHRADRAEGNLTALRELLNEDASGPASA